MVETYHETVPEQVKLQLSGIRIEPPHIFAFPTQASYLAHVAPNHVRLCFFHVSSDMTGAHLDDHGCLRGVHTEKTR